MPAAVIALLVSIAFTVFATHYPHAATLAAAPVTILALLLMMWSRRTT